MSSNKGFQPNTASIVKTMQGAAIASSISETRHFIELMQQTYGAENVRISAQPISESGHTFTVTLPLEQDEHAAFVLGKKAEQLFERITSIAIEVYGYPIWANNDRRTYYLRAAFWCYRVITNLILDEEFNDKSIALLERILDCIPNQIVIEAYDKEVEAAAHELDPHYAIDTLAPFQLDLYSRFIRRIHRELAQQISNEFHEYGLSPAAARFPEGRRLWHEALSAVNTAMRFIPHHIKRETLTTMWGLIRKLRLQTANLDDVQELRSIIIDLKPIYDKYA